MREEPSMTSLQDSERGTDAIERARGLYESAVQHAHAVAIENLDRENGDRHDDTECRALVDSCYADLRRAILKHDPVVTVLVEMARFIDEYETPFHYPSDEERAQYMACPECTRRREDRFFPGNHCDAHYRVMVMKYERRNEDERSFERPRQWREAARAALTAYREAVEGARHD